MSRTVEEQIIDDIFWSKYSTTINASLTWQQNLNNFLSSEWSNIQGSTYAQMQFSDSEVNQITSDAKVFLLTKLSVSDDGTIDWTKFNDIIGCYICLA